MRILEIILLITSTLLPVYCSQTKLRVSKTIILASGAVFLTLHLLIEGYRWQMLPAYFLLLISAWYVFKERLFFKGSWLRKLAVGIPTFLVLIVAWALPISLPVFTLNEPSGAYSVGSQYIHLQTSAEEPLTPTKDDRRELMIKVWYPASLDNEETEAYLNDGDRAGFAVKYGLPPSMVDYLDKVETNTYLKPLVAEGKFPVLIFSPGIYANASGYYALLEEIVSHGYVVLNINHSYESTGALFPDGEIKLYGSEYDRQHNDQAMAEMVWIAMKNYKKASSPEEEYEAIKDLMRDYYAAEVTMRWSKDISHVIDALDQWDQSTFLAGHINTTSIGVFGHSQGGSAAGQATLDEPRIKAGFNVDGAQWGGMIDTSLSRPFALLSSDWQTGHPNLNKHAYRHGSAADFYSARIGGSGHSNFMDIPLMIRIPVLNEAGRIDPHRAHRISSELIVQFFDTYLLGKPSGLLKLSEKYSELSLELKGGRE